MKLEHRRAGPNDSIIIHEMQQKIDDSSYYKGIEQMFPDDFTLITFKYEPKVVFIDLTEETFTPKLQPKLS